MGERSSTVIMKPYEKADIVEQAFERLKLIDDEVERRKKFDILMTSLDLTDLALMRELWLDLNSEGDK